MGAQRVKSYELTQDDLERVKTLEEEQGITVPPHLIGEIALTLVQQSKEEGGDK